MYESMILLAECKNCNNKWKPYGERKLQLPHSGTIICPKCGYSEVVNWVDSETKELISRKTFGVSNNDELIRKIHDLEQNLELLTKEVELEKKKRELFEIQLEKFEIWADDREEDFLHIEKLAEELDDEKKFREDNK